MCDENGKYVAEDQGNIFSFNFYQKELGIWSKIEYLGLQKI